MYSYYTRVDKPPHPRPGYLLKELVNFMKMPPTSTGPESGDAFIKSVARAARQHAESLLRKWLPGGTIAGDEYNVINPLLDDRHVGNFKVNLVSCKWSDFALDGPKSKGGDLVSLYAYLEGTGQLKAAREIAKHVGHPPQGKISSQPSKPRKPSPPIEPSQPSEPVEPSKPSEPVEPSKPSQPIEGQKTDPFAGWRILSFIPDGSPAPPEKHRDLGKPSKVWVYQNPDGLVSFYIYRFDLPGKKKETRPLTPWVSPDGSRLLWRWKGPNEPRPLYRLNQFYDRPDAPVLVVEGEKAACAAANLLPDFVCTTSPFGSKSPSKADWAQLKGREVVIWPDKDKPGEMYAVAVARLARAAGAASIRIVDWNDTPDERAPTLERGMDIADLEGAGWSPQQITGMVDGARAAPESETVAPESDEAYPDLETRQQIMAEACDVAIGLDIGDSGRLNVKALADLLPFISPGQIHTTKNQTQVTASRLVAMVSYNTLPGDEDGFPQQEKNDAAMMLVSAWDHAFKTGGIAGHYLKAAKPSRGGAFGLKALEKLAREGGYGAKVPAEGTPQANQPVFVQFQLTKENLALLRFDDVPDMRSPSPETGRPTCIESHTAEAIAPLLRGKFGRCGVSQTWHFYDVINGFWQPLENDEPLLTTVEDLMAAGLGECGYSRGKKNGVVNLIERKLSIHKKNETGLLPFKEQLLVVATGQLIPATPDTALRWVLPYTYFPEAKCPTIDQWLWSVTGGDERMIHYLLRWLAAILRGVQLQKYLHLIGPSRTGKGTLMSLATELVGKANTASTEFSRLSGRFESAGYIDKRLVLFADAKPDRRGTETFKMMTGGDLLPVEGKFKNTYFDTFKGIIIVASNESIEFGDHSDAIYKRRCVVPFNRVLPDSEIAAFDSAGGKEQLFAEIPGLVNRLLQISEAEIRNTLANPPPAVVEAGHDEECAANPISKWVFENLIPCPQSQIDLGCFITHNVTQGDEVKITRKVIDFADTQAFPNFLRWRTENEVKEIIRPQEFSRAVIDSIRTLGHTATIEKPRAKRVFVGVRLRTDRDNPPEIVWFSEKRIAESPWLNRLNESPLHPAHPPPGPTAR